MANGAKIFLAKLNYLDNCDLVSFIYVSILLGNSSSWKFFLVIFNAVLVLLSAADLSLFG